MEDAFETTKTVSKKGLRIVTGGVFLLMIGVATLQVVSRYLPDSVPFNFLWTGELATYMLVFVVFFGAVLAEIDGGQLRIDIVRDQFIARIGSVYELFVLVSSLAFTVVVVYGAFNQTLGSWDRTGLLLTWFKIGYLYAIITISFLILTVLRLWRSVDILTQWTRRGRHPSEDHERGEG